MGNFDGSTILDWIKGIAGNIFMAILIVRSIGQYSRADWADMLTSMFGAVIVAGIIYFPDQVQALLRSLWG